MGTQILSNIVQMQYMIECFTSICKLNDIATLEHLKFGINKTNLVVFIVSLLFFGLSNLFGFSFVQNQSLVYQDASLGFKFQYPVEWKQFLEKDRVGSGVAFSPLPTRPSENFADLLIYTSENHQNKTLKEFMNEIIREQLCCIDNQSLKYNDTHLSGIPSINASWDLTKKNNDVYGKALLNLAIKDGNAYVIHYDANLETFARWLPEVKNIINSFQLFE